MIRLSIVIATYNRGSVIGKTVENIAEQLSDEVELLVVDGASTDNTGDVVQALAAADQRIRYFRLEQKGGVDKDYCRAVELARGEFCWLFTDDDFFRDGAVSEVLKAIGEGHDLIIVNLDVFDKTMQKQIDSSFIKLAEDKCYDRNTLDDLVVETMHCLTFIGSVIIRRSLWLEREKEKYFGTEFIHVGVIFQKPVPGTVKVIARPLVNYRYGMAQWSARGFKIWMFKWPELVWSFDCISDKAKSVVCRREPWRSLWTLLVQRSIGTYSFEVFKEFLVRKDATRTWKLMAIFIALLPKKLVQWGHCLYTLSRDKKSRDFFAARN